MLHVLHNHHHHHLVTGNEILQENDFWCYLRLVPIVRVDPVLFPISNWAEIKFSQFLPELCATLRRIARQPSLLSVEENIKKTPTLVMLQSVSPVGETLVKWSAAKSNSVQLLRLWLCLVFWAFSIEASCQKKLCRGGTLLIFSTFFHCLSLMTVTERPKNMERNIFPKDMTPARWTMTFCYFRSKIYLQMYSFPLAACCCRCYS